MFTEPRDRSQDFELIELLFQKIASTDSDPEDQLDKSFEVRFQSLVDQIQSYLHSTEKDGFFPHRFLGWFSSVLDTGLSDKLDIKKLHFRFEGAKTLKVVAQTECGIRVFIFTEEIKTKNLFLQSKNTGIFEFTRGEWKKVTGKDYTESDACKLQIDMIRILKDKKEKSSKESKKISIEVERGKVIHQSTEFKGKFQEITKELGESVYLESYIERLANSDAKIDQVQDNLKEILTYIKKVHTNLNLQANVYGVKAREADQHGFVAGIFDNFRYRDNTKLYLEQFAGGGCADIVLLVRGPNRAVDSVPILIELKAGTEGQVDPSDALEQAEGYIEGFRPNKMRILTNAGNVIAVGLNLDYPEPFKTEVKLIRRPPSPLMEELIKLAHRRNNQQISEENFKQEIADLLSSEYRTFPANKETKDHYYFSRNILGQSILINKIGQDQSNIKKYIYSYDEYPLNWPKGTEYSLSKSPVMTLILVQGNEGQEKTAFIFHIRESNTREFYVDKKISVLDIPEIGRVGNVIEIKMSLAKYKTGASFKELFKIEPISRYKPSGADQQFTGSFLKVPNSNELKAKFDQAITSQHTSDGEGLLQAYKVLLTEEVADAVYPVKGLIANEARLQAILNGLFSSYSDLKLQEPSAKVVIVPEFQVGAGGCVDMVIQGIGPSPQGTKEYTPIALEFKLINKNLDEKGMKEEVDKLTREQNIRYAKGAALKAITDSNEMFFMGVVVNVKAQDKDSLILMSDKFISAKVIHSSIWDFGSLQSLHFNRKQQEVFSQFVSHNFPNVFIKSVKQGLYLSSFEKRGVKINGKCVAITWGLSQALLSQSSKSFLNSLEASARVYERMAQHMQVSKREEREVFALSKLLDSFERKLDSSTSSLPLNLTVAFISGLKSVDQLIGVVKKGIKSASYTVEERGLLVEHFDVAKANNLLSSEDKQILAKEIKTERQLLEEQDKELGLIKINGQGLSRVQLYDFGTKINVEGGVPLLISADINLSSKKFQDHLDRKEVSMTAREYLGSLKGSKNVEEVTKVIPFEGSKREIEEAKQVRKPKRSLSELVKGTINYILAAVSLSRSESQLPGKIDNKPETYLNDPIIDNQLQKSPGH